MSPQIIFEDDLLLVIDKPSGIVVNRADTTGKVGTVQDWVEQKCKNQNSKGKDANQKPKVGDELLDEFGSRSGIVHRLDKDTSGLLVLAKTPEAFESLKSQFKGREVAKKYLALVHGRVEPSEGTIKAPIARSPFNPKHFGVFPGGREAETTYVVLKHLQSLRELRFSFLELTPRTGRTHQIRVHLKYINHPIVSDPIYGGRKNLQADLKFCPRLFLHAASLSFEHPLTGKKFVFESSLPSDLDGVLKLLK